MEHTQNINSTHLYSPFYIYTCKDTNFSTILGKLLISYFSLVLKTTQNFMVANSVLVPTSMEHEDPT